MRIAVSKIPKDGYELRLQEKIHPEGVAVEGPVDVYLKIRKFDQGVVVEGSVSGDVRLECGSCLETYSSRVSNDFTAEFRPAGDMPGEGDVELIGSDLDVATYEGDDIELTDLISEQILLGLPIRPVCSDGCKGLCPACGANRNIEDCGCRSDQKDPRFRVLMSLKGEGHGESNP